MRHWWWITAVVLGTPGAASAQYDVLPTSERGGYVRMLELDGDASRLPLLFHSLSSWQHYLVTGSGPWHAAPIPDTASGRIGGLRLRAVPLQAQVVYNSRFPSGTNDDALWAGRGFALGVSGGIAAGWRGLSVWAYPTVVAEQNRAFDLVQVTTPGLSAYAYPWGGGRIDWPQRFGDRARGAWDWGQSGVRADWRALTVGVSTENLVWGPAVLNPILMSANAPGFPHVDLGTGYPLNTPVGRMELRLVWGRLSESAYFDTVTANDHRLFTGFTLGVAPRWLPGLTVGMARVLYMTWDDSLRLADYVGVFQPFFKRRFITPVNPEGDDDRDQLLSLSARWVLGRSGFEAYVEWARNDHNADFRDFMLDPSHSQAFTFGFQKTIASGRGRARIRGEFTSLGRSASFQVRATPTYYTHHLVRQGYTHRGQVIGAGIGPGSDSQFLGFDRYFTSGRWGLFVQRVTYNDDAYYIQFGPTRRRLGHNVHFTTGASTLRRVNPVTLAMTFALTREFNRQYVIGNDQTNFQVSCTVTWHPNP